MEFLQIYSGEFAQTFSVHLPLPKVYFPLLRMLRWRCPFRTTTNESPSLGETGVIFWGFNRSVDHCWFNKGKCSKWSYCGVNTVSVVGVSKNNEEKVCWLHEKKCRYCDKIEKEKRGFRKTIFKKKFPKKSTDTYFNVNFVLPISYFQLVWFDLSCYCCCFWGGRWGSKVKLKVEILLDGSR